MEFMLKNNIVCQYLYIPIFKFSVYKRDKRIIDFTNSKKYQSNSVSLPIFYGLTSREINRICEKIYLFVSTKY